MFQRLSWHDTFMQIADVMAQRSSCLKIKTAAVIVTKNKIIATGYNGTFPHAEECDTHWCKYYQDNINVLHADAHDNTDTPTSPSSTESVVASSQSRNDDNKSNSIIRPPTFEEWLASSDFSDVHREWSEHYELHAESNAIMQLAKSTQKIAHCTMYTIYLPCNQCTKLIINAGIKYVIYRKFNEKYLPNVNILRKAGVKVFHHNIENI